jgi:SAM-dependent methyltransferase
MPNTSPHFKTKALDAILLAESVVLDIGCGSSKKDNSAIGIDAMDFPGVDIIGDVFDVLSLFPNASVDEFRSAHFIEHIDNFSQLIVEIVRILKPGGRIDFIAPHFSNPYYYSDVTHRRFFGLYSFSYFTSANPFARKVPTYDMALNLRIDRVDLYFKSTPPFYVRHAVKKLHQLVFNSCTYMRELYEENFSSLFPCYEVRYRLTKTEE